MVGCKEKYGAYSENNSRMLSLPNANNGIFDGVWY
jgi:hypothetical protein